MRNTINSMGSLVAGAIGGTVITIIIYSFFVQPTSNLSGASTTSNEKKPLYWVAPMDPNYRRDKPGKSPMGMDLIPVYEENDNNADTGPGTIKIAPEVVNNLGVRTTTVQLKALHTQIKTVGYVQYDEDHLIHIHPRVEGWIEKLYVKAAGDPVKKGQALYELYSPALVNAQEELVLALDRKNQRLIQAAEDRLRALQLPTKAIKQLQQNKKVKQTITFFAPQNGVVDNLNIREGSYVKPGTTLMSIGQLDQVWVLAEVFERQASVVTVGIPVTMTLAYLPGKTWQGKVDYIYPTLNAKTRTVKVKLRFNNENNELKPNMFANVIIHANNEKKSLLIPKEAVIRSGNFDRAVLALGNGRFKSIEVKVGRYDEHYAEILSGLDEGEKIVTSAQFLLDSESSKSSDFKRMTPPDDDKQTVNNVWVEATIHDLMSDNRMINASHQPIDEWGWPEMTMDFTVADSVDFNLLKKAMTLHIKIQKNKDGSYEISNIHIPDMEDSNFNHNSATTTGVINSIMAQHRMLNISRGPIPKWNRPATTMDFIVNDSIDMSLLSEGLDILFTFQITNGEFIITDIKTLTEQVDE